jgi:hypothetical protein
MSAGDGTGCTAGSALSDLSFVRVSANLYNRMRGRPDVSAKIEDVAMEVGLCGGQR